VAPVPALTLLKKCAAMGLPNYPVFRDEDHFASLHQNLHAGVMFRGLPINRMTGHLFDDLRPFVEAEAALFDGDFDRALASILRTKCSFASGDPGNTGEIGDIHRIPPNLWLVRNEVGGWTAMFPEDY